MIDLKVKIAGLTFPNPIMPAAGPPTRDGEAIVKAARAGAGGVVAKTVSVRPAPVPRPNMMVIDRGRLPVVNVFAAGGSTYKVTSGAVGGSGGFLNTEMWTELTPEQWFQKEYKTARKIKVPLIASIGYTPEEVGELAPKVAKAGADAIEFSTHYVKPGLITEIVKTIKKKAALPVFPKLSPHSPETLIEQAKEAEKAGADAIVAINSFGPTLAIDPDTGCAILGGKFGFGWMSGPPLRPLALRCVFDICRNVKIPVIGVGGISSGTDVAEFLLAGASAVQVCTAAILEGSGVWNRLTGELRAYMEKHGYAKLADFRGKFLKSMGKEGMDVRTEGGFASVDEKKCKGCRLCYKPCVYGAISFKVAYANMEVSQTDKEKCFACGLCATVCPAAARGISWE